MLFLILYRKLLHPGAAPVLSVVRMVGTRTISTKVTLTIPGYQTLSSDNSYPTFHYVSSKHLTKLHL